MRSPNFLFLLLLLPLCAYADFDVRPAPAWVAPAATENVSVARENVRFGIYGVLSDHQVRVAEDETAEYFRRVRKVLSPNGVQNASELSIDFDPSFQRLVLHEIAVIRDGRRIDALEPEEVRIIEKEDDASERIYDGEMTALVFIKDVRPGDVIDYSWSVIGANPLLGDQYADEYDLSSAFPARLVRHRLLWPAGREIFHKGLAPRVEELGELRAMTWERRDVAAIDVEDSLPAWYSPWETVEVSTFARWNDVALWADALFRIDEESAAAVQALAARIRTENATQPAQVLAAIRFVQDDIRYLGIEMGRNSHEPHQPAETLAHRWGDCKDKTFLLVALLRELGVQAWPALVNTSLDHRLADRLPSPFVFDHVIAQVAANGRTFWIDGTISDQGGTLETIETPNDSRALVIHPTTTALAKIETNERGATVVEHTYTAADYTSPASLDVVTTYTGANADSMRSAIADMSLADLAKERINRYAVDQPKIAAVGLPKISDDRARNVIVVRERYQVRDLWRNGRWTWQPRVLQQYLGRPHTMIRSMPLAFDYPLNVTQKLIFNLPERFDIEAGTRVTDDPAFRYEMSFDSSGNTVTITHSLRAKKDHVAVAHVSDHLAKLNEVWDEIGYELEQPAPDNRTAAGDFQKMSMSTKVTAGAVAVGVFVGFCVWLAIPRTRFRPRRAPVDAPASRTAFRPGEAPAHALAVRDEHEMRRRLAGITCPCGAGLGEAGDVQQARYDEKLMTIVTRRCPTCGREQSLYFAAA